MPKKLLVSAFSGLLHTLVDALVDFFPMYRDVLRCGDAYAHLVSLNGENRDCDVVADHNRFAYAARQIQHVLAPI
jgi:hypothetical protein